MDDQPLERQASFVIRIWRERGQMGWRAWVQHTRSGTSSYVGCLDDLWAFFERWVGDLHDASHKGLR